MKSSKNKLKTRNNINQKIYDKNNCPLNEKKTNKIFMDNREKYKEFEEDDEENFERPFEAGTENIISNPGK